MTVEAWALTAVAAVFILAYTGARQRADRWEDAAKRAMAQAELAHNLVEEQRALINRIGQSNMALATLLARAVTKLKEQEDEGEWWKKGRLE